jgi:hypothetical protein
MKFAWCKNIVDLAAWNSGKIKEVDLDKYSEMLEADKLADKFDKLKDKFIIEDLD